MPDTKEKLPSENGPGAGFKGIKSGNEQNMRGSTRVEVGEPKGNQARQMRAVDGSEEWRLTGILCMGVTLKKISTGILVIRSILNMEDSPELYYCGCLYDEEGCFYDDEEHGVEIDSNE